MRQVRRRGFTLIELLVVVGMIVLLATILLPMVNQARKQATRAYMAADLQVISQALEAYKHDFGDYPRLDRDATHINNEHLPFITGAALLCWALVAPGPALSQQVGPSISPGDGANGPGFRLRGTVGPIKGPYLPADRFVIGTANNIGIVEPPGLAGSTVVQTNFNNAQDVLADRNSYPILYFAATPGALATSSPNGFVKDIYVPPAPAGDKPSPSQNPAIFVFDDNAVYLAPPRHPGPTSYYNPADLTRGGWKIMSYRLGDTSNPDGVIDPTTGENPITTGPYLLWSAGPDGYFGDDDDVMCDGSLLQPTTGPLPFNIQPHP